MTVMGVDKIEPLIDADLPAAIGLFLLVAGRLPFTKFDVRSSSVFLLWGGASGVFSLSGITLYFDASGFSSGGPAIKVAIKTRRLSKGENKAALVNSRPSLEFDTLSGVLKQK